MIREGWRRTAGGLSLKDEIVRRVGDGVARRVLRLLGLRLRGQRPDEGGRVRVGTRAGSLAQVLPDVAEVGDATARARAAQRAAVQARSQVVLVVMLLVLVVVLLAAQSVEWRGRRVVRRHVVEVFEQVVDDELVRVKVG